MLAFGGLAYGAATTVVPRSPRRLAAASVIASFSAALFGAVDAGGPGTIFEPTRILLIFTKTTFGIAWSTHILFAAMFLAAALRRRTGPRILLGIAALNLASFAPIGHAGAGEGLGGLIRLAVHGVHLIAVGFWFGALPPLVGDLGKGGAAGAGLAAFSRTAVFAALAAGLTGFANAFIETGSIIPDLSVAYGRYLAAKIGLFAILLAIAAVNRFYLTPRRAFRPIARLAGADLIIFAIALAVAVALAESAPTG